MKGMKIKSISLQNFKGCKDKTYDFNGKNVSVSGANATGKTTILDAFWWLLFNKDSLGNEKFSIRPLDTDGNVVHNIEIKVAAILDVNGRDVEFIKTQKEKWVKKRGTDTTELAGNENIYEIDGYPKTEKEFKERISDIISEDIFKMITNPAYFPNLKWKEQREVLMRFIDDVSDYDLASKEPQFEGLLEEIMKAPSTDDIKSKYQKSLTEWKKRQSELPVRIDEISKQKVDVDISELELGKKAVIELIKSNSEKQSDISEQYEEHNKLSNEVMNLKFELSDLVRKSNESLVKQRKELQALIDEKNSYLINIDNGIQRNNREIYGYENDIDSASKERDRLAKLWHSVNQEIFDKNTTICPTCKQKLPEDKIQELMAEFEENKKTRLAKITKQGLDVKADIDNAKDMIPKLKQCNEDNLANKGKLEKEIAELEEQLSKLPMNIDISKTEEYKNIQLQIEEKEKLLNCNSSVDEIRKALSNEKQELDFKLLEFEKQIALANKNFEIDERILELQTEQREVAQKILDVEKILYLLEEFIRYKMSSVSSTINSKFGDVCFKLFENQINGGLKETCECTVHGVPYGSLNAGHRIVAGLQIIKALQKLYEINMPIFIDNAESVNDFNIPNMDCQMIMLKVSDNKELKVESEE